jgi:hypothetical protein
MCNLARVLTPQEAVLDEYGAMVEWLAMEIQRNLEESLLHCHIFYHRPHLK